MPTLNGNFLLEMDGVAQVRCTEIDTGGTKQEPFKYQTGDQPNPILGRGKFEVDEIKIKQGFGIGGEAPALAAVFRNYILGIDLTKPTIRVVHLDEDGVTTLAYDDYVDCVPVSFVPEGKKGDSKDAACFSIAFKPTDHIPSY